MLHKKNILALLLFSIMFVACSKDNNNPTESSSPLTGKWALYQSTTGGNAPYSIEGDFDLTFEGNNVSGNGTINYSNSDISSLTIQNSVSGSYNDPNISVTISGNSFTFIGGWDQVNVNFKGTAKINTGNGEYTYTEVSLFENN